MRRFLVLALAFAASTNALHPRCRTTTCASPYCPSGYVSHGTIGGAGPLIDDMNCDNVSVRRNLCCDFPVSNVEWQPPRPVDNSHACLVSNPCTALGKVSLYEDEWGPESRVCYSGKYWRCSTAPAPPPPPSAPGTVGTFSHQGCYTDSSESRGLTDGSYVDQSGMTIDKCIARAAAAGAKYASVEYSYECFWGNTLRTTSVKVANNECTSLCAGNSNQPCGGPGRMNVYQNNAYVEPPKENPSYNGWNSMGCYSDSMNARALEFSAVNYDAMSVGFCTDLARGYKYAAVEYGSECYWGNTLASTSTRQSSGCTMACPGWRQELCGGPDRINLYINSNYVPPPPPASTNPGIGDFRSIGCYVDDPNARALPNQLPNDAAMTVAKCIAAAGNSKYAGVQNGNQCFYGDALSPTGVLATDGGCTKACGGKSDELCGGSRRLTMYENRAYTPPPPPVNTNPGVGEFRSIGCYVDDPNARTLPNQTPNDAAMTVAKCIAAAGNSKYAGVENGNQCFYGNAMSATGVLVTDGCTKACGGKADEYCGGSRRITMYENRAYAPPPDPKENPGVGSYKSLGCYVDSESRTIKGESFTDSAMTVEKCINRAGDARYAGVENGNECWYGDELSGSKGSGCTTACLGKSTELCGGGWRLNVYEHKDWETSNQQVGEALEEIVVILDELRVANDNWLADLEAFVVPTSRKLRRRVNPDISLGASTAILSRAGEAVSRGAKLMRRNFGVTSAQRGDWQRLSDNYYEMAPRISNSANSNIRTTAAREAAITRAKYAKTALGAKVGAVVGGILGALAALAAALLGRTPDKTTTTYIQTTSTTTIIIPSTTKDPKDESTTTKTTSTSTSSSTTLPVATYLIYPTPTAVMPLSYELAVEAALVGFGVGESQIVRSTHAYSILGISYWKAPLNIVQKVIIEKLPGVASVELPCTSCNALADGDRAGAGVIFSRDAEPEIEQKNSTQQDDEVETKSYLSRRDQGFQRQRRLSDTWGYVINQNLWQMPILSNTLAENEFVYDGSAGEGSTLYVLDTGTHAGHFEFTTSGTNRWLNPAPENVAPYTHTPHNKHGTCMMSVASGLYYGIAKKVNRVHIAVPTIEAGDLPMTHWIDALAKILEDVALTGNGPRAVLSLSLYFHPNYMGANLQPMWIAKVNFILRRLIDRGVFVVAGSGNNGESQILGFPAAFAKPPSANPIVGYEQLPELLIVGGIKGDCNTMYRGTNVDASYGLPHVYAPGEQLRCADTPAGTFGAHTYRDSRGTSAATAVVAGLAAYFRGLSSTPIADIGTAMGTRNYIISLAAIRQGQAGETYRCAWNRFSKPIESFPLLSFPPDPETYVGVDRFMGGTGPR